MKIRKIVLNNIRSYENQEVVFPEGSTLLSGDIGSGKTSILLAIEFALFGLQPGQKSSSLLKNGKNTGGIVFHFEINGKEIIVERNLKKSKSISQDTCYLTIDGSKTQLSVMELKSFILDLLNYPKEYSKKQNILYKFTVYTPQEEMKQIIQEDSESRMNTLRYIFGIDKYKTILENVSLLASKIREEKRIKEGMISNVGKEMLNLSGKETELQLKNTESFSINNDFLLKKQETKKIQEERENVTQKVEERNKLDREIEKNKLTVINKADMIANNERLINSLNLQIQEIEKIKFSEQDFLFLTREIEIKKKDKDKANEDLIKISSEINSLSAKNTENNILKNKISHLDTCPTCLQIVNDSYKTNIAQKCDHEILESNNKLTTLASEKNNLLERSKNLNIEIAILEKRLQEMNLLKLRSQDLASKINHMQEILKSNELLRIEIESLNNSLNLLSESFALLEEYEKRFEEINRRLDMALSQERAAEIKVVESKREIEFLGRQIKEIKSRIAESEKIREQINYLTEVENWLSSDFTDMVSLIEKNIMMKLKHEFSRIFSEWFSMLVSESFNAYVRDDFTPIIEQQDYELDYEYLSGGERTAVALAYRLALNQLINSVLSNIETKDLVILDEPTDGFSSQQLDKMRDVLNQLNVKQLIIVSHEQKIEAFVENIIRFKKENGISKVEF
ncbi:hypothetical protein HYT24_02300 [Candidatus Pacearchaeota archaeon]|nr:hypothetical protein [Candidatus Pacearchaeota archaeon]